MPWKEPGKGDKDPWKSGGQQPPDLEEIFGNVSKRLQSLFGGGGKSSGSEGSEGSGNSGFGGAFSLVLLLIVFWAAGTRSMSSMKLRTAWFCVSASIRVRCNRVST